MTVAFARHPIWHIFSQHHVTFLSLATTRPSIPSELTFFKTRASHDHKVHAQLTVHSSTTPHDIYFHRFSSKITVSALLFIHRALTTSTLRRERITQLTTTNLEITQLLFLTSISCRKGGGGVRTEKWWPADLLELIHKTQGAFFLPFLMKTKLTISKWYWLIFIDPQSLLSCATFDNELKNTFDREADQWHCTSELDTDGRDQKPSKGDHKIEERGHSTHSKALWRARGDISSTFQIHFPLLDPCSRSSNPPLPCCAPVVIDCWGVPWHPKGVWVCVLRVCVYVQDDKQEEEGGHNMAQWNLWEPVERSALHFIFFFFFWFRSGTCCLWVWRKKK